MPDSRFTVYTREDCLLCDEFIVELARTLGATSESFEVRDVDANLVTRRRFGLKIPVLTCNGSVVCHGHLDRDAVLRLL